MGKNMLIYNEAQTLKTLKVVSFASSCRIIDNNIL